VADASLLAGVALSADDRVLDVSSFEAVAVSDEEESEAASLLEEVALAPAD
jgi:hypothetical protein